MKISIDIDCTPEEARTFLGLPDIKPMQDTWLAEMEKKLLDEMENFTAESLVKSWMTNGVANADLFRKAFEMQVQASKQSSREKK